MMEVAKTTTITVLNQLIAHIKEQDMDHITIKQLEEFIQNIKGYEE